MRSERASTGCDEQHSGNRVQPPEILQKNKTCWPQRESWRQRCTASPICRAQPWYRATGALDEHRTPSVKKRAQVVMGHVAHITESWSVRTKSAPRREESKTRPPPTVSRPCPLPKVAEAENYAHGHHRHTVRNLPLRNLQNSPTTEPSESSKPKTKPRPTEHKRHGQSRRANHRKFQRVVKPRL